MMLEVLTNFNEGATRYYKGERVSESNFAAGRVDVLQTYGWLSGGVPAAAATKTSLNIHDAVVSINSEV
jgi:hypothetical protein